jgi:hypothetical protein
MSRQDKATTDRNAKILRALVKAPDNKVCADCRRNGASSSTLDRHSALPARPRVHRAAP